MTLVKENFRPSYDSLLFEAHTVRPQGRKEGVVCYGLKGLALTS
jgi:hypothetical protein